VYAFNYGSYGNSGLAGIYGVGHIVHSAEELSTFVNYVLALTGASQVDIVGHSQGGMMPRYYLRFLGGVVGGVSKVHTLVALAPSNHGTSSAGLAWLENRFGIPPGTPCPACEDQEAGSAFLTTLNYGGDTMPGVNYTVIQSIYDEVVTPFSSAFLTGPGVTNIELQSQCALDHGEHLSMPYDHIADGDVLNALDPAHPKMPRCTPIQPYVGG
jgi:pimeloyl-ACP methyl ester carboxylesterase